MKQLSKNKKIIYGILLVIILAGIIVTATVGFNFDLIYQSHDRIEVYIGKDYELNSIKEIAKEVFDSKEVRIQKVELFNEAVAIIVKDSTDEQTRSLKAKIDEKYELDTEIENVIKVDVPHTRLRDIIKKYVLPTLYTAILILVYVIIINLKNKNLFKLLLKILATWAILETLYFSLIAILRIPFSKFIMPIALAIYLISTIMMMVKYRQEDFYGRKDNG